MHRHEGNAKPAESRLSYFFPKPSWVNVPTLLQGVAKTQKYIFRKFAKSRTLKLVTMTCRRQRRVAEKFYMGAQLYSF